MLEEVTCAQLLKQLKSDGLQHEVVTAFGNAVQKRDRETVL